MRTRAASLAVASLALALGAAAALPALPASAKQSPFNLKALKNSINRTKNLTYEAVYNSVSSGQPSTVTVAQAPPKTYFSAGSSSVISTGKDTYYCSPGLGSSGSASGNSGNSGTSGSSSSGTSSSAPTCVSTSMTNPLLGVMNSFSSQALVNALNTTAGGVVARVLGIKISYSSASYGGQPSSCVTIARKSQSVKYCVTKQGVLSYASTSPKQYFELTKYSSNPSASLFALPSGATVETLPTGSGSSG